MVAKSDCWRFLELIPYWYQFFINSWLEYYSCVTWPIFLEKYLLAIFSAVKFVCLTKINFKEHQHSTMT